MTTVPVRLARGLMWLVLTTLVLAAIAISGLRFFLPQLNEYREPIRQWASEQAEMRLEIAHVEGYWRNLGPSLLLQGVEVAATDDPASIVRVGDVEMQFDMLLSVFEMRPVFKDIRIDQLSLDLTRLPGSIFSQASPPQTTKSNGQASTVARLEQLIFVQLGQFSLRNSDITVLSPAGHKQRIDISELKWDGTGGQHLAEGVISVADTHFSQMRVIANLSANRSLPELSGNIYVQTQNLSVTPWLNKKMLGGADVTGSNINAEVWLNLKKGEVVHSLARLDDSYLRWREGEEKHEFRIRQGLVGLTPQSLPEGKIGWRIDSDQMLLQTDKVMWPAFDLAAQWQPERWQVALSSLPLDRLMPFVSFLPQDNPATEILYALRPSGQLQDIRIAADGDQAPRFSVNMKQFGIKQWELLPGVSKLDARISGNLQAGKAVLDLKDDTLPYGEVFQAPLNITDGEVTAYWQVGDDGWRLWSDQLAVKTPHLKADGQFRLDFPANSPAWLSFYGEASVSNAGETWRYLPTLALGRDLTDYLSTAIRGGKADGAQLLWYGELADFPYHKNDGVFQVDVPLKDGRFSFDTAWPELTDLALDLRFENDFMYLDGSHAKTLGATASRVTGAAELSEKGHLKLALEVGAEGPQIRDYMLATPLVDSVGAALTTVQISGPVTSRFKLDIPFDGSEVRAWGSAQLDQNLLTIETPPIQLEQVGGSLSFDNDVIKAENIQGMLLAQPVTFGFAGNSVEAGYQVGIELAGDWQVAKLQQQLQDPLLAHVSGHSPWQAQVGVNLHDTGFDYDVDLQAPLAAVNSQLPYPLSISAGTEQRVAVTAAGNAESLTGTIMVPDAQYQAVINLVPERLKIEASELLVGQGKLHTLSSGSHSLNINSEQLDADHWLELAGEINDKATQTAQAGQPTVMPELPLPTRVNSRIKKLKLATLNWNEVDLAVRKKPAGWHMILGSREMTGEAFWPDGAPLRITLDKMHLNLPGLDIDSEKPKPRKKYIPQSDIPAATEFDRSMMANMPEMDLLLQDAWLQGYRLGKVTGKLRREGSMLELQNLLIDSGSTSLNLDGHWTLDDDHNETQIAFDIEGENSSDLMGRFGVSGGIQGAKFSSYASIQWQGSPWMMHRETLTGEVKTETGKGVISDVGGAGRLLGLFSIDSIVRKMQLDFSGIFDDGLAFNYIKGSGTIENGLFESNDVKMQALAGDMFITGSANLVSETVDARVKFIPDFTSGIPVLTAFAVAPQTAIFVFAISTALSPVVDVFTQINYVVKGPIDSPSVTEQSRFTGEYTLPEKLNE
ncbi:TIGR02099 family protein [Photobacterium sp. SDRW27]|uniref:YhdP family protein n=1 Tax=Photobacterium obscurum TaxID=2829490 RepID=UPI00224335A4|nr:YhdP family protein [Photobacterium obscurum]MCW8330436.1 TIGR02099 family protein [Photobacterium obscurum]